jgi:hypothetical protein
MSSGREIRPHPPLRHPSDLDSQSPNWHPCGLVRLVEATGRTRGSSATPLPPSLQSSTPNRGLESRDPLKNLNNSFNNNTTPNWNTPNHQDRMNSGSRYNSGINRGGEGYIHNHRSKSQQSSPTPCHGLNNRNDNPPKVQHSELHNQDFGSSLPPVTLTIYLCLILLTVNRRTCLPASPLVSQALACLQ